MDFSNVKINENYNYILKEKGNTFIALRKIQWAPGREEKLDLRKYNVGSDGSERMSKGVGFDDETADELVNILTKTGYGETKTVLNNLKDRPEFLHSLAQVAGKEAQELDIEVPDIEEEEFFDIRSMMVND